MIMYFIIIIIITIIVNYMMTGQLRTDLFKHLTVDFKIKA